MSRVTLRTLLLATAAIIGAGQAQATPIANGNAGISILDTPAVNLAAGTYTANHLGTYETFGTGAFTPAARRNGTMNGTLAFSSTRGTTLTEAIPDFLVFNDGVGGTFNFSVSSVLTRDYSDNPGVTSSVALYLLGTTLDAYLADDPTPTSLTLTFNSSSGSDYTASATLAVPPAPLSVVEPATALLLGAVMIPHTRRRRRPA